MGAPVHHLRESEFFPSELVATWAREGHVLFVLACVRLPFGVSPPDPVSGAMVGPSGGSLGNGIRIACWFLFLLLFLLLFPLCLVWGCARSGHRLVHVGIHVAEMAPNAAPWVGVFGFLCCRLFAQRARFADWAADCRVRLLSQHTSRAVEAEIHVRLGPTRRGEGWTTSRGGLVPVHTSATPWHPRCSG